ncbi:MAG TPA: ABC transporter substrate-binding protein, partial [Rhodopila sp.]|nr:ABC transporter substrate-binding protein [Rhodopila sp.]
PIPNFPVPTGAHPRVFYARGPEGTLSAAPGTDVTAVFARLGWQVVAPEGSGTFRLATPEDIDRLDPDVIILADPAAQHVLTSPAWATLRAVREGHAYAAPAYPFGWIEEPPSVNRLAGLAWLRGADPLTLAALLNASLYGRALTTPQLQSIAGTTPAIKP